MERVNGTVVSLQALSMGMLSGRYRWLILCPLEQPETDVALRMRQDSSVLLLQPEVTAVKPVCTDKQAFNVVRTALYRISIYQRL